MKPDARSFFLTKYFRTGIIRVLMYVVGVFLLSYGVFWGFTFIRGRLSISTIQHQAIVGPITTLNPLYIQPYSFEHSLSEILFRGLMQYSSEGLIEGDLAESWDVRNDGQEFLVHIKQNQKWSDDSPITVDDFIYTYELTQDENYTGWAKGFFSNVEFERIDDYTILIKLPSPFISFLDTLTLPVVPRHVFDSSDNSPEQIRFIKEKSYSGPYSLAEITQSIVSEKTTYTTYTFEKNNSEVTPFKISVFSSLEEARVAFELGKIDEILYTPNQNSDSLVNLEEITLTSYPLKGTYYTFIINLDRVEDASFRKSLVQAIDKNSLPGTPALGPIPEGSHYFAEASEYRTGTAKEEARSVLNGKEITFTTYDTPEFIAIGEAVKKQLEELGVSANLQAIDISTMNESIIPERNYDYIIIAQHVGRDPDVYSFWHSSQIDQPGLNLSKFVNRRVDKSLERGRQNNNLEERKKLYVDFQQYFLEDTPAIFLTHPELIRITKNNNEETEAYSLWELEDYWLPSR